MVKHTKENRRQRKQPYMPTALTYDRKYGKLGNDDML